VPVGSRPGRWGRLATGRHSRLATAFRPQRLLVYLAAVAVILSFVGPFAGTIRSHVRRFYASARRSVAPSYAPVIPVLASATSQLAAHPASSAIDGVVQDFWATAPSPKEGVGQSITIDFGQPVTLSEIGFLSGDQATASSFASEARPARVRVHASDGVTKVFDLLDETTFQTFPFSGRKVTDVTVTILSVYPSAIGRSCAIAQIEFFERT